MEMPPEFSLDEDLACWRARRGEVIGVEARTGLGVALRTWLVGLQMPSLEEDLAALERLADSNGSTFSESSV